MYKYKEGEAFNGEEFWNYVESEGRKSAYSGSEVHFHARPDIPYFYDEIKFKRAQLFFQENLAGIMVATACGLVSVFSEPEDIKLLIAASANLKPITGYKRYKAAILHLYSWYQSDLIPGSTMWKSLMTTRKMHDFAIDVAFKKNIRPIDQAALATTQFGFMGFSLTRLKDFGLESSSRQDLEAMVHFWRVIGYMVGIEHSFNMCRDSLDETISICNAKMKRIRDSLFAKHELSLSLQFCVLGGLYPVFYFEPETLLNTIYNIVEAECKTTEKYYYPISASQHIYISCFMKMFQLCRHKIMKRIMNAYFRYIIHIWRQHSILYEDQLNGVQPLTYI